MNAIKALFWREVLRFVRQKSRWIGALATPLLFWAFVGGGFQGSFKDPGHLQSQQGYLQFFFPGAIVLSILFTAIFSTMSVIQDRHEGFLQGVLVAPLSRISLVFSKILGGAALGTLQGVLLLSLAPFVGFPFTVMSVLGLILLMILLSSALTALGFIAAWRIDSVQGYHGIMNVVLMPMWLLSGSVFPAEGAHPILRLLMKINPLSYAVGPFRVLLSEARFEGGFTLALLVLSSMTLILMGLSTVSLTSKSS